MKTAVIFHRLGPYHFARLRAAGRLLPVTAIETSGADETYAWDQVAGADGFERVTLFADADAQKQPAQEVARCMAAALDKIQPQVVAVPGWADAAALAALQWCIQNRVPAIFMSESTAGDEPRKPWKEYIKRRIVTLGAAGLAGGTPHRDYLARLGMPVGQIFLGYDAVDNSYFADKVAEVRSQKSGVRIGTAENGNLKPEFQVSGFRVSAFHDASPLASGLPTPSSQLPAPVSAAGPSDLRPLTSDLCSPVSDLQSPPSANCQLPSTPYFLASARFVEKKNLPRLIAAYARYRTLCEARSREQGTNAKSESQKSEFQVSGFSSPPSANCQLPSSDLRPPTSDLWSLVLLGDGPLRSDLCHRISDLRLQSFVLLPGFKQYHELPAYYAAAGAFIHASTTEQWGLVVNEAMASGLPVLVSNRCGCARDLVQDGVNGFTFDPYNVEQLAELMFQVSSSRSPGSDLRPLTSDLSQMGAASARLISAWGPDRFASGLKAAAECALRIGLVKPSLLQRTILQALIIR
ncbi:MAG: glycosyltransferase [Verrucomicrobiota bacterium]